MSTIKHPVGPQPSKVYWRRRLVVGFGLLAVIVVILLIVVPRPAAGGDDPRGTKKKSAASATSAAATKTPAPPTIPEEPTAVEGAACNPKNVQVDAISDAVEYGPTQIPQLSLSLTNTGKNSCVMNAGTSKQVLSITSGSDLYWTSTDCQTDPVDAEALLKPGIPVSSATAVAWDRTRSSKSDCAEAGNPVPSGGASYNLSVTVDGIESASPKRFLLY